MQCSTCRREGGERLEKKRNENEPSENRPRQKWVEARKALLAKEKEMTRVHGKATLRRVVVSEP
jgi:predicted dithiol-disulfide oxidoreductase (DUF899 family)